MDGSSDGQILGLTLTYAARRPDLESNTLEGSHSVLLVGSRNLMAAASDTAVARLGPGTVGSTVLWLSVATMLGLPGMK